MKLKIYAYKGTGKGYPIIDMGNGELAVYDEHAEEVNVYPVLEYAEGFGHYEVLEFDKSKIETFFESDLPPLIQFIKDDFYKQLLGD